MCYQVLDVVDRVSNLGEGEVGYQVPAVRGERNDDEQPPKANQDPAGDGLREVDPTWKSKRVCLPANRIKNVKGSVTLLDNGSKAVPLAVLQKEQSLLISQSVIIVIRAGALNSPENRTDQQQ